MGTRCEYYVFVLTALLYTHDGAYKGMSDWTWSTLTHLAIRLMRDERVADLVILPTETSPARAIQNNLCQWPSPV